VQVDTFRSGARRDQQQLHRVFRAEELVEVRQSKFASVH